MPLLCIIKPTTRFSSAQRPDLCQRAQSNISGSLHHSKPSRKKTSLIRRRESLPVSTIMAFVIRLHDSIATSLITPQLSTSTSMPLAKTSSERQGEIATTWLVASNSARLTTARLLFVGGHTVTGAGLDRPPVIIVKRPSRPTRNLSWLDLAVARASWGSRCARQRWIISISRPRVWARAWLTYPRALADEAIREGEWRRKNVTYLKPAPFAFWRQRISRRRSRRVGAAVGTANAHETTGRLRRQSIIISNRQWRT